MELSNLFWWKFWALGWGIAVYTSSRHLCAADNGYIARCEDVEPAELKALRHALLYATARKLSNVLSLSNCIWLHQCCKHYQRENDECILWTNYQPANYQLAIKCRICLVRFWILRQILYRSLGNVTLSPLVQLYASSVI